MEKHLNAPEAKFLLFKDGKPLMQTTGETKTPTGLLYLSQSSITPYLPSGTFTFAQCPDPTNENKDMAKQYQSARLPTTLPALVFLGIDDRTEAKEGAVPAEVDPKDPKGVPYFALDVSGANITLSELDTEGKGEGQGHGAEFVEPRLAGSSLGGWEANLFAQARALMGKSPGLAVILKCRTRARFSKSTCDMANLDLELGCETRHSPASKTSFSDSFRNALTIDQTGTPGTNSAPVADPPLIHSGAAGNEAAGPSSVKVGTVTVLEGRGGRSVLLRKYPGPCAFRLKLLQP